MTDLSVARPVPFIVMEYIENDSDLVDVRNTPGLQHDNGCILYPNVDELRSVHKDIADICLSWQGNY